MRLWKSCGHSFKNNMNLISISTDRGIFTEGSAVRQRMVEYGGLVDQLHVICFSRAGVGSHVRIASNVWVYPTHSRSRFFYVHDANRIGAEIVKSNIFSAENTIVSTQDPFETGLVGAFLKKRFGLKLQVQIHTDFLSPYFARHSFLNWLRVWIARRVLPHANQIRVVSERIKKSLARKYQQKAVVLPIWSDASRFAAAPAFDLHKKYPQFSAIITMVSRLAAEKNINFALRIFKEVLKKFPAAGLVIVGDGPEKGRLQKLAAQLGIVKSTIFALWADDVVPYYKTTDIFLSTSLYEGYGLSLVEAGLAGAAVVTSDVGIAGELLLNKEEARICPVGDAPCFTKVLEELLVSPETRKMLGREAHDVLLARVASRDQYVQNYQKLLRATLNEK